MAKESEQPNIVEQLLAEETAKWEANNSSTIDDDDDGERPSASSYTTKTYNVPDFRTDMALKHLNALSIKAVKLGMPAFAVEKGEPFLMPADGTYGIGKGKIRMVPLTVTGGPPMIEGWRFLAKIDHDGSMNIVQGFGVDSVTKVEPGFLKDLQNCEPNCEHCNLKRNRKTTFIFQNVDDPTNRIQVGSACVDDFSGHKSPDEVVSLATRWLDVIRDYFDPDDDGFGKPARSQMHFEVEDVLAASAAIVRQQGHWVSRDSASTDGSSADWVQQVLLDSKTFSELVKHSDEQEAKDIVAWLRSDSFDDKGVSYLGNLQAMAIREAVPFKMTGFLASAVATWHREQGRRQKVEENPQANIRLGNHGEKITLDATVEKIVFIDNNFGGSDLTILKNDTGAKMVWFNSGRRTMSEGDTYHITGTVKGHEQRDGVWQTKLTRVNSPEAMLSKQIKDNPDNTKAIQAKIKAAQHINARDGRGDTPLLIASYYHQNTGEGRAIIDALLEAGADYTIPSSDYGMTPVDHWIVSGELDLIGLALHEHPELASGWTKADIKRDTTLNSQHVDTITDMIESAKCNVAKLPEQASESAPDPMQVNHNPNAVKPERLDLDEDYDDLPDIRLG